MARTKKNKTQRRRDTAVSITGLAEAAMIANVGTMAAFNLSAWDFLSDGWTTASAGKAHGLGQISLHELIYGNYATTAAVSMAGGGYSGGGSTTLTTTGNSAIVMANLQNNAFPAIIQAVAIPVGFRVGKRLLRRPIAMGNKLLKQAGLRSMVKI